MVSVGFVYLFAFGVRPLIDEAIGLRLVAGAGTDEAQMQAMIWGMVGMWAFAAGCLAVRPPRAQSPEESSDAWARCFLWIALAMAAVHALFAFRAGALTLNFGQNRIAYLMSLVGSGQVLLSRDLSFVALGLGFFGASRWARVGAVGWAAAALVLLPNLLVSSRSALTQMVFLGLLVVVLQGLRQAKPVRARVVVLVLGVLTLMGLSLGVARGVDEEPGGALRPVIHFSQTFDMAESLELSLLRISEPQYGQSWAEDLLYTYIPRALDPEKPIVYGAFRLQQQVYPELTPPDEVLIGTFPIGAWGEGFANFGYAGIVLTLGLLGWAVSRLYARIFEGPARFQAWALVLYCLTCANALSYTRSVGQFLAAWVYLSVLLAITTGLAAMLHRLRPSPVAQKENA
ncbi:MAG TPA: hypothetical protein PLO61_08995 [Fimbriimonadaceae bacterium]|nr:hypothetical protein [Fimbriimonadaceae bacterium]